MQRDVNRVSFLEWAQVCTGIPDRNEPRSNARKNSFLLHLYEELAVLAEEERPKSVVMARTVLLERITMIGKLLLLSPHSRGAYISE